MKAARTPSCSSRLRLGLFSAAAMAAAVSAAVYITFPLKSLDKLLANSFPGTRWAEFSNAEFRGAPLVSGVMSAECGPDILVKEISALFDPRFVLDLCRDEDRTVLTGIMENRLTCVTVTSLENSSTLFITQILPAGPRDSAYAEKAPWFRFSAAGAAHSLTGGRFLNASALDDYILEKQNRHDVLERRLGNQDQGQLFFRNGRAEIFLTYVKKAGGYVFCEYRRLPEP